MMDECRLEILQRLEKLVENYEPFILTDPLHSIRFAVRNSCIATFIVDHRDDIAEIFNNTVKGEES